MTAEQLRREGQPEAAADLCRQALSRFPGHLSMRVTLGWALLDQGQLQNAREAFEHVRAVAPDNLAAIRGLAELHAIEDNQEYDDIEGLNAIQGIDGADTTDVFDVPDGPDAPDVFDMADMAEIDDHEPADPCVPDDVIGVTAPAALVDVSVGSPDGPRREPWPEPQAERWVEPGVEPWVERAGESESERPVEPSVVGTRSATLATLEVWLERIEARKALTLTECS